MDKLGQVKCSEDCLLVVNHVLTNLESWSQWAIYSKTFACLLGGAIAALTILIGMKKLPDIWHYALSATLATSVSVMGLLQPYEEYKQFRAAYAKLERGYMEFTRSDHGSDALNALIISQSEARELLKENWEAPKH